MSIILEIDTTKWTGVPKAMAHMSFEAYSLKIDYLRMILGSKFRRNSGEVNFKFRSQEVDFKVLILGV